jgi:hypothetical protein
VATVVINCHSHTPPAHSAVYSIMVTWLAGLLLAHCATVVHSKSCNSAGGQGGNFWGSSDWEGINGLEKVAKLL